MINGQKEIWISTGNKSKYCCTIIAVSNCGRIMRKNGKIEIASYRQLVYVGEKRLHMNVYRFLANNFIVKTEEDLLKQRNVIDHITHTPDNMHINDIRNLRWCTLKENCNFPEAKLNKSKAQKGKKSSAETKAKMSEARKGMKLSEEHRANLSLASKGMKLSEEHRAKLSAAQKGKKRSAETKEKISKNSKAGTPEVRAKTSAAKKGCHWYNNGIVTKFARECPPGFTSGRIIK